MKMCLQVNQHAGSRRFRHTLASETENRREPEAHDGVIDNKKDDILRW